MFHIFLINEPFIFQIHTKNFKNYSSKTNFEQTQKKWYSGSSFLSSTCTLGLRAPSQKEKQHLQPPPRGPAPLAAATCLGSSLLFMSSPMDVLRQTWGMRKEGKLVAGVPGNMAQDPDRPGFEAYSCISQLLPGTSYSTSVPTSPTPHHPLKWHSPQRLVRRWNNQFSGSVNDDCYWPDLAGKLCCCL